MLIRLVIIWISLCGIQILHDMIQWLLSRTVFTQIKHINMAEQELTKVVHQLHPRHRRRRTPCGVVRLLLPRPALPCAPQPAEHRPQPLEPPGHHLVEPPESPAPVALRRLSLVVGCPTRRWRRRARIATSSWPALVLRRRVPDGAGLGVAPAQDDGPVELRLERQPLVLVEQRAVPPTAPGAHVEAEPRQDVLGDGRSASAW